MEGGLVDFTIEEKDVRGLRFLLAMGLCALKTLKKPHEREAVRAGCKVLKLLNPVAREIAAEEAGNAPQGARR